MIFQREVRYIVIKLKDIDAYLTDTEKNKLKGICTLINDGRLIDDKPEVECVVVESDWPEYEQTWQAIEKRVNP